MAMELFIKKRCIGFINLSNFSGLVWIRHSLNYFRLKLWKYLMPMNFLVYEIKKNYSVYMLKAYFSGNAGNKTIQTWQLPWIKSIIVRKNTIRAIF